jgi:anti-anti-sigma factor
MNMISATSRQESGQQATVTKRENRYDVRNRQTVDPHIHGHHAGRGSAFEFEEGRFMTESEGVNGQPDQIEIVSRLLAHGVVLAVSGEIDIATAPTVERELRQAEASHDFVVIDLSEVSFMDSTGLHLIVAANRRLSERGGRLFVVEGSPQIRRLFEVTRLAEQVELVQDAP